MNIPFLATYALADCAARVFAEWRTSRHPAEDDAKVRQMLRNQAVEALRFMWKSGDASARTTVACRVAVWMRHGDVSGLQKKISERETLRFFNAQKKAA